MNLGKEGVQLFVFNEIKPFINADKQFLSEAVAVF